MTPEVLLTDMGINFQERTGRLMIHCPFHHDTDPSSGFYIDTQLFHCFACELTLDMVGFYAKYHEMKRADAHREVEKKWGEGAGSRRKIDRLPLLRARKGGEDTLKGLHWMEVKEHAKLGEMLDKICLLYERGIIEENELNKRMQVWRKRVDNVNVI